MIASSYASATIDLAVDAADQPLEFDNLLGVALRRNPKRAHLLVSRALGKHTPQRPDIIDAAARVLAVQAGSVLDGEALNVDPELRALNEALRSDRAAPVVPVTPAGAIVVGFAEAASALGASVADHLGAYYVCSTRTPLAGVYGEFTEEHSHASAHYLTPADTTALNDPSTPVILVDDELTTGRTAMNLIRALHAETPHPHYVIATLADLRDSTARKLLHQFTQDTGISVSVVALFTGQLTSASDAIDRANTAITQATDCARFTPPVSTTVHQVNVAAEVPHARDGVASFCTVHATARDIIRALPADADGLTLVLGVEEDMMLPLRVATLLQDTGADVMFSSTTRSPAAVFDRPDYPIRDALTFPGADGAPRFVYNVGEQYENVIIIASDPLYAKNSHRLLTALRGHVQTITLVTITALAAPLRGPQFGSYEADDVAWLLKDLSATDLEVDLAEREQFVQSGGHYAEALPVEYQPDAEYLDLFWAALEDGRDRVARDVVTVGDRILAARGGQPVLVSLARAGTPVGVLLRRWFLRAYKTSVPHYAVSIVRGRGIDHNALRYLAAHHDPRQIIFVDGWTGKGAIKTELDAALRDFQATTGIVIPNDLAVLADTAQVTSMYGTRDDYLIPSAALNSTVSGLISRTVLNDTLIGPADYHGAKFYDELAITDVSCAFIDEVTSAFPSQLQGITPSQPPTWSAWESVERISDEYGIGSVNLVKPGVGETTRVLLRRVPWKVLIHPDAGHTVQHIRVLAASRGVPVEVVPDLPFNAVGLIHPVYTKGATDFDGRATA